MSNPKKNKGPVETFCNAVFVTHDLSTLDQLMRDDYIQHNTDAPGAPYSFFLDISRYSEYTSLANG